MITLKDAKTQKSFTFANLNEANEFSDKYEHPENLIKELAETITKEQERKKAIIEFEKMIAKATANAYSKLSLERPLTPEEYKKFKEATEKL